MPSRPSIDSGLIRAVNRDIASPARAASAMPRVSRSRVATPATSGISTYRPTDSISVVHGTSMSVTPSSRATIGANAKIMITSLSATWASV